MIASVTGLLVGIYCGAFAGADGTRPFVGLAYGLLFILAGVLLLVVSTAVFTGAVILPGIVLPILVCCAVMSVAYFLTFVVARRIRSRTASTSRDDAT